MCREVLLSWDGLIAHLYNDPLNSGYGKLSRPVRLVRPI